MKIFSCADDMRIDLRPYQMDAVKAIRESWQEYDRTLAVMPTGTGKTIVFAAVAAERTDAGRVLILAHRDELLQQAGDKITRSTGCEVAFEKAEQTSIESDAGIIVGSVQTLQRAARLDRFGPDHFKTIIIDEAHHALAEGYRRVIDHFNAAKVLGVTATPDRGDKRSLSEVFDGQCYEYKMRDAINDGYLVPIRAKMLPVNIDMTNAKTMAGDYSADYLGEAVDPYLNAIADMMVEECRGRKTVVFLPLIATAKTMRDLLAERGLRVAEVDGTSPDRAQILAAYDRGEYDILCNAMLLTEGWDCPAVDCVVCLRPTKIRSLYQQMVGRGMRLSPETGKKDLLLLDFLWMTEKHDLCGPASLVAKDANIAGRIENRIRTGAAVDLIEAETDAENAAQQEREAALARELRLHHNRKAKTVNPMDFGYIMHCEGVTNYDPIFRWQREAITEGQRAFLERNGIQTDGIDRGLASVVIGEIMRRREEGLATVKQVKTLKNNGFDLADEFSFEGARHTLSRLADYRWRLPAGFDASTYIPRGDCV